VRSYEKYDFDGQNCEGTASIGPSQLHFFMCKNSCKYGTSTPVASKKLKTNYVSTLQKTRISIFVIRSVLVKN